MQERHRLDQACHKTPMNWFDGNPDQACSGTQHKKKEKVNKSNVQEGISFPLFMSEDHDNSKELIRMLRIMIKKIIGPDNPTCSQFPSDTEFRQNATFRKGI